MGGSVSAVVGDGLSPLEEIDGVTAVDGREIEV